MSDGRVIRADPRLSEMRRRYLAGASLNEVGQDFGITGERVRRLFREAGLRSRSRAEASVLRSRQRADRDAAIVARVAQARDIEEVAQEFAVSVGVVNRLLRRDAPSLSAPRKNDRVPRGYWTRERILDAICAWERRYGEPPVAADWNPAAARRVGHEEKAERFEAGLWPYLTTVSREFGRWSEALAAAARHEPAAATQDLEAYQARAGTAEASPAS